ncbi:MAG TPA: hypothetical protein ENN39_10215 [Desulfonatronum sp.]|nr:hypothetical protein [Desulfonatronum sp.]
MSFEKEKSYQKTHRQTPRQITSSASDDGSLLEAFEQIPAPVLESVFLLLEGLAAWEREAADKK